MFSRTLLALAALTLLTACGSSRSLEALRTTTPTGDAYQVALANGYKAYAEEFASREEWELANYFASKGLRAARNEAVEPENPTAWKFREDEVKELADSREQLMKAIANNRSTQPEPVAAAVVGYDRWLVLKDQNGTNLAEAHDKFSALLAKLQEAHVASETAEIPPPSIPSEVERTVLYFPFDSDRLGDSALTALKQLAHSIPDADDVAITINGHADRVGSDAYNMKLSERRAKFVLKQLVTSGIPSKRMKHFAFGESDPAVPTSDGVEEPKNRRVEVIVE